MIHLKTDAEIEIMSQAGEILRKVVSEVKPQIEVGMTTEEIDTRATDLIKKYGGEVSFNKVPGYSWATCLPINDQIVHTPPSKRKLKNGDLLTLDIGVYLKGYHVDYADAFIVGENKDPRITRFLQVGKETLDKAIAAAKVGHYIGEISQVIETGVRGNGYYILRELTGHGVGHDLHEDPYVPGFLDKPVEKTYRIKSGLVIAVEVIYSMGSEEIAYEPGNSWSIITKDRSISACFEATIALTDKNTRILT